MSEERELLRETVAATWSTSTLSPGSGARGDGVRARLRRVAVEAAVRAGRCAALVVPEELGGAGGELADAAVVLEELGKALVPTPLLGTTLAELALLAADEPDTDALERAGRGRRRSAPSCSTPSYVVNGDVADVVIAADGTCADPLDRVSPRIRPTRWTRPAGWRASTPDRRR